MRFTSLCLSIILIQTMIFACGLQRLPAKEPITSEYHSTFVVRRLTASTNCAEIGEEIVFTATIINPSNSAVPVLERPAFDMIIQAEAPTTTSIIKRWSETDQYPRNINPVLQPGETRTYAWRWVADAVYTTDNNVFGNGIRVDMPITAEVEQGYPFGTTSAYDLTVGVKSNPRLPGGPFFCADLR